MRKKTFLSKKWWIKLNRAVLENMQRSGTHTQQTVVQCAAVSHTRLRVSQCPRSQSAVGSLSVLKTRSSYCQHQLFPATTVRQVMGSETTTFKFCSKTTARDSRSRESSTSCRRYDTSHRTLTSEANIVLISSIHIVFAHFDMGSQRTGFDNRTSMTWNSCVCVCASHAIRPLCDLPFYATLQHLQGWACCKYAIAVINCNSHFSFNSQWKTLKILFFLNKNQCCKDPFENHTCTT